MMLSDMITGQVDRKHEPRSIVPTYVYRTEVETPMYTSLMNKLRQALQHDQVDIYGLPDDWLAGAN